MLTPSRRHKKFREITIKNKTRSLEKNKQVPLFQQSQNNALALSLKIAAP